MCNVDWLISISDELVGIWFVIGAIFFLEKKKAKEKNYAEINSQFHDNVL